MAGAASSSSLEFQWGERVAGLENSYERMCCNGVWYSLLDCVYTRSVAEEPYVGKLMRLYEEDGKRKIRVRWFLRASELPFSVSKDLSGKNKKELFIAQGSIKGVENVNLVETILGKAIVLCTAKVPRNPHPSQQHVDDADFYFNRAYDAHQRKLVKMDRIEKSLALKLFNKPEWLVKPPVDENASWEDLTSPTSVTDFDMVARKRFFSKAEGFHGIEQTEFKKIKGGS